MPDKILECLLSDEAEDKIREVKEQGYTEIRDIFQEEQGNRKNLKQDFTPDCLCEIVSQIIKDGDCVDLCSGTGALSKQISKTREVNEYEYSERTIPFALLDTCVNGMTGTINRADCLRNIVFESYEIKRKGEISLIKQVDTKGKQTYKNVIMNPPYSMKFEDSENYEMFGFKIPKSKADYGFILRGIQWLEEDGRMIAILPHGILFRGGAEGKIRKWMLENHLINAIIGVPDKLFLNTQIPVFLLVIERNSENVLFIDASKEFVKGKKQNDLDKKHIKKIVNVFIERKEIEKFSHISTYEEIHENDFNLNIPRYVDTYEEEPLPDIQKILAELKRIDIQEEKAKKELYNMLEDLTGNKEDMRTIERHKALLKPRQQKKEMIGQMTFEGLL